MFLKSLLFLSFSVVALDAATPKASIASGVFLVSSQDAIIADLFAKGLFGELLEFQKKENVSDLDLSRFPLSNELPKVDDFRALFKHGYNYLPCNWFSEWMAIVNGRLEIYKFFRQKYSEKITKRLAEDFNEALDCGNLRVVIEIVSKDRSVVNKQSFSDTLGTAYHIIEWLKVNVLNKDPKN
jgi:hypothetical protein